MSVRSIQFKGQRGTKPNLQCRNPLRAASNRKVAARALNVGMTIPCGHIPYCNPIAKRNDVLFQCLGVKFRALVRFVYSFGQWWSHTSNDRRFAAVVSARVMTVTNGMDTQFPMGHMDGSALPRYAKSRSHTLIWSPVERLYPVNPLVTSPTMRSK